MVEKQPGTSGSSGRIKEEKAIKGSMSTFMADVNGNNPKTKQRVVPGIP